MWIVVPKVPWRGMMVQHTKRVQDHGCYHEHPGQSSRSLQCRRSTGQAKMGRRIIGIVLIAAVVAFLYLGYTSYDAKRAGASGDVYSNDPVRGGDKTDKSSADSKPASGTGGSSAATVVYPTSTPEAAITDQPAQDGQPATVSAGAPAGAPGSDTISPNPPNGMAFSGRGKYQVYRQGNLTWRLNTETGQSCILFATDEEWSKPKVYRAGCGS